MKDELDTGKAPKAEPEGTAYIKDLRQKGAQYIPGSDRRSMWLNYRVNLGSVVR